MRTRVIRCMVALAVAAALAGGAAAQDRFDAMARDLTEAQKPVLALRPETPRALSVGVEVDRLDRTYTVGQPVSISVKANKAAYVTILAVDPTGTATILFPNAAAPANLVRAGQSLTLPGPMARWTARAHEPAGVAVIKVIASTSPTPIFSVEQSRDAAPFRILNESLDSIARDLPTILDSDSTTEWAEAVRLIRVAPPR